MFELRRNLKDGIEAEEEALEPAMELVDLVVTEDLLLRPPSIGLLGSLQTMMETSISQTSPITVFAK